MKRHKHKRTYRPLEREKKASKGTPRRRVIASVTVDGREYWLHSTKGYRSTKV